MSIDRTARIHPTATLEGAVTVGAESEIGAGALVRGPVVIGARTKIGPNAVIGLDAEHRRLGSSGVVRIGNGTIIRELAVIHRGTGERDTEIGDDCYLMAQTYVAHDSFVGRGVTMAAKASIAGRTRIFEGANLGLGCVLHQRTTVGAYAMVGMGAVVTHDVPAFCVVVGNPARFHGIHARALRDAGWPEDAVRIEGDRLVTTLPELEAHFAKFRENARRAPVSLLERSD
jgi:UDP-N-acetylglucosamine acyltransferase